MSSSILEQTSIGGSKRLVLRTIKSVSCNSVYSVYPESNQEETSEKHKLANILEGKRKNKKTGPQSSKRSNVKNEKFRLRNYSKSKEIKKHDNQIQCHSGLDTEQRTQEQ